MFDLGWGELLVIGIVALIAIGPKELPGVLRALGQWMGKIRHMASEFQGHFREAMREAEMADIKKQVDELGDAARGLSNYDPLQSVRGDMDRVTNTDAQAAPSLPAEPSSTALAPAEGENLSDAATPTTPPLPEPDIGEAPKPHQGRGS